LGSAGPFEPRAFAAPEIGSGRSGKDDFHARAGVPHCSDLAL
jgi:hypothetical protein